MKMRRSLWRKLLVLALAILTAISTYWTIQHYIPAKATSGLELVGTPMVTSELTSDPELPYFCTVICHVKNTSSSSKRPVLLAVTLSDGSVVETCQLPFPVQTIAAGSGCDVSESFMTERNYQRVTSATVTMGSKEYVLYGNNTKRALPDYVKATMAISVILFGVFVYSCVALYKSPKKKVHTHHHHHHHHHSSHHDSDES